MAVDRIEPDRVRPAHAVRALDETEYSQHAVHRSLFEALVAVGYAVAAVAGELEAARIERQTP